MKYIRTKNEVIDLTKLSNLDINDRGDITWYDDTEKYGYMIDYEDIIKTADTIEELCDEFVCQENDNFYWLASRENVSFRDLPNCYCKAIFGAIWTDKGLIYKARMKGVLPNGEIDWELL